MVNEKVMMLVEDFLKKKNPTNWDGSGDKPVEFDTRMLFYEMRIPIRINLTLSYEWQPMTEKGKQHSWVCVCRCWNKDFKQKQMEKISPRIESKDDIYNLILSVCKKHCNC